MDKISYDEFKEAIQMITSLMSDDDKFEFYQELLETGSACVSERTIEHNFAIINGLHYEEVVITPSDDDDDELEIDLKEIELQADSIEDDDVTEMTEEEIMQIGINPWTNEKVDFNYLQKRLDDFIRIFQERLQNDTLEITMVHNRENLTHFNFIKTIIAFYQEQTKDSNKPKVNELPYPDLHIQWRLDDFNPGDEMPSLVSIEPNEDRAFDYWLIHDRTNGDTKEIVIKANELGEYDISELIEYISERVKNDRLDW